MHYNKEENKANNVFRRSLFVAFSFVPIIAFTQN